jgi:N-acetylmuramoyl-L-alanine amidase
VPIQYPLKKGSQDAYVKVAQQRLMALGFALPRFGADGALGDETLGAYGAFLTSRGLRALTDAVPKSITPTGAAALDKAHAALGQGGPADGMIDERANHPHDGRSKAVPFRPWPNVTGIVLHQTASSLGESPARWHSVPIHFGITRQGKIIQLYDLTEVCNHASNPPHNQRTVGIEIDGWFCGIEGRFETLWQPRPPAPQRQPMDLPTAQADAAKKAVQWIAGMVSANGGRITHIHPHRQSSDERRSDPGSLIWQTVGLWAQSAFNLTDGGADFTVGNGLKIPKEWDPRYVGNRY